ncbi:hypothetical protein D3C86_1593870 [compost metagenome]
MAATTWGTKAPMRASSSGENSLMALLASASTPRAVSRAIKGMKSRVGKRQSAISAGMVKPWSLFASWTSTGLRWRARYSKKGSWLRPGAESSAIARPIGTRVARSIPNMRVAAS